MSSREIAKLTGKPHDNVMSDIKKMLGDIERHPPDFLGTYQTDRGNTYWCYNLPRRETDVLLTGYSVPQLAKFTADAGTGRRGRRAYPRMPSWSLHRLGSSDEGIGRHANEITAS